MIGVRAIAGLIVIAVVFLVIVLGGAMIVCQIGARHLSLQNRFSLHDGCQVGKAGEWWRMKDD